jgi:hypothetical protein
MARLTGDHDDFEDPSVEHVEGLPIDEGLDVEGVPGEERRDFAHAVPMLLVMMGTAFLMEVAVLFAGLHGPLLDHSIMWLVGVPTLAVLAVAGAGLAQSGGWLRDRSTRASRPLTYGVVAGLTLVFVGLATMQFLAHTSF